MDEFTRDAIRKRPRFWYLDGDSVIPLEETGMTRTEYFQWWEGEQRVIARDDLPNPAGEAMIRVSTVFLGMDHSWYPAGPPILFETMIFAEGWPFDQDQERYATAAAARAGHAAALARVSTVLAAAVPGNGERGHDVG